MPVLILALKATSLLPFARGGSRAVHARVLKAGLGTDRLVLTRCLMQFSLGVFDTTVLAWDHRGVSEDNSAPSSPSPVHRPHRSAMESAAAEEDVLLHGDLLLTVIEAHRLPNMDYFSEHLRRCYTSCRPPLPGSTASKFGPDATQHHHHRKIITSDPYVTASLAGATIARTRVISNSEDPAWNEHFNIPVAHRASTLELQVKDNDVFGAQLIGIVSIPTARIAAGKKIQDWFPIIGPKGKPPKPETALHLSIEYIPVEEEPEYQHGISGDPEQLGVRNAYFPLRKGGSITLYQDAHVRDDELPVVTLEKGAVFKHEKCWEDICHAILEAHHLIYLVGWSIYHKVKLVRESTRPLPDAGKLTLGDLLKYKSQEGVRVCLMVWDDKTSHDKLFIKTVRSLPLKYFLWQIICLPKFSKLSRDQHLHLHSMDGCSVL
ncbi:hypothetical protein BHE74_00016796 [Ensete ventricosum]|nr:hypothetical protein BHE74_00016796 [Ensete ventricosum]